MSKHSRRFHWAIVMVIVLGAGAWAIARWRPGWFPFASLTGRQGAGQTPSASRAPPAAPGADRSAAGATTAPIPATATATAQTQPLPASLPALPTATASTNPGAAQQTRSLADEGLALLAAGKLLDARAKLADALNAGNLEPTQEQAVRARLLELANRTIFSRELVEGDPCAFWYTVRPGDVILRIERDQKLHVPPPLILHINGLPDASKIQVGQRLKLLRGPLHAVVRKGRFQMDIYLQEPGTGRMLLCRQFAVGLGKDGCTPEGRWRVALGGKMTKAPWTPPSASQLARKKILWGEPDYPLGVKGYWISLAGIEGNPYTAEDGFGIHGTNDPSSIGKAQSMGCIRLPDDDIEQLFALLYEHWSLVSVLP